MHHDKLVAPGFENHEAWGSQFVATPENIPARTTPAPCLLEFHLLNLHVS
jgi:hypothetical protein